VTAEHEAKQNQLRRELQLREEKLVVAHALLKQAQVESSASMQRVSRIQAQQQTLEQGYEIRIAALNKELADGVAMAKSVQQEKDSLVDQLKAVQVQVATLEEEAVMREDAFHLLMLSEDSKKMTLEMQRSLQTAREEAEDWKLRYYMTLNAAGGTENETSAWKKQMTPPAHAINNGDGGSVITATPPSSMMVTHDSWADKLNAREAALAAQAKQLEAKAQLLNVAEAKLQDMRRSIAMQASTFLKKQPQDGGVMEREAVESGHSGSHHQSTAFVYVNSDGKESGYDLPVLVHTVVSWLPPVTRPAVLRCVDASRRSIAGSFRDSSGQVALVQQLQRSPRLWIAACIFVVMFIYILSTV